MIAEVDKGRVRRISDLNEWLSLGEIVARTGGIPAETEKLIIKTFRAFQRLCLIHGAGRLYIFATEAMRRASNGPRVIADLARLGIPIDLIDGRREAEFGLRGAWLDSRSDSPHVIMAEVGGGSAQVALASGGPIPKIAEERSLRLGTGALIGELGITQPADDNQVRKLKMRVKADLAPVIDAWAPHDRFDLIGVGGVARGVWRSLHPDGNPVVHVEEIDYLIWATRRLSPEAIAARFNVKLKRAATLLPGAIVYRTILQCAGLDQMRVSKFGVREGALLEMAEGRLKPAKL